MTHDPKKDNAGRAPGKVDKSEISNSNRTPPQVTGQCAKVLSLIRELQPVLSFTLTADHAIPETAARIHNLRAMGFDIRTTILPDVEFRGAIRRNAALYSIGSPEWPAPGFLDTQNHGAPDE